MQIGCYVSQSWFLNVDTRPIQARNAGDSTAGTEGVEVLLVEEMKKVDGGGKVPAGRGSGHRRGVETKDGETSESV